MGRRGKKGGGGGGFNSFIDIMTCLAGVLILIILLVILQIQEVKVVLPTPMQDPDSNKMPVFIECRSNMLYKVELDEIRLKVDLRMEEIADGSRDGIRLDRTAFLGKLGKSTLTHGPYSVDLSYALTGQFAMWPDKTTMGYALTDIGKEKTTNWFGNLLSQMDGRREMLTFIVRDDSFFVFKKARALAWVNDVDASWYLVAHDEPLKFGLSGEAPMAQ